MSSLADNTSFVTGKKISTQKINIKNTGKHCYLAWKDPALQGKAQGLTGIIATTTR